MKIADGLDMLQIRTEQAAGPDTLNPSLIWDENDAVLVDTGMPNQLQQFREAFAEAGVPFERLGSIVITHSDIDHMGGLAAILNSTPQKIEVIAHEKERPFIQAELPPIRLRHMEEQAKTLPEGRRQQLQAIYESLKINYPKLGARVGRTVEDGEILPSCGGIEIIYTPGHTPGHICLYHRKSRTLIAGDMLNGREGILNTSSVALRLDKAQYAASLRKLTAYDIANVVCYHGGIYDEDVNARIAELAASQE